jgi:DNA-binding NtrC family response regulator
MQSPTLLIVDDDPAILKLVGRYAERAGFEPVGCLGGGAALQYLSVQPADVAVVDLRMPDIGGLDVVRAIRAHHPECQVALMSGAATIDSAVEAVKLGAVDYLTKPIDVARINAMLAAAQDRVARRPRPPIVEENAADMEFCGMIGRTPSMQRLFRLIRRVAPHARNVLVRGETGVGKELVARALHLSGPRRQRRFLAMNCAAVAASMYESQLFGHVKGAFSGAGDARPGLFEFADGGTVFLDEVANLPLPTQAKLLRILESGEIRRLGAIDAVHADVQMIGATNRDMQADVATGRLRVDLLSRLSVVEITVPPLRHRREDIPHLAAAFIREISARLGKRLVGTTSGAERRLVDAPWRGNVRELRNVIERACILAETEFITERDLASGMTHSSGPELTRLRSDEAIGERSAKTGTSVSVTERNRILDVLQRTGGNKMSAARILGLSRRALYRRLERYGISED